MADREQKNQDLTVELVLEMTNAQPRLYGYLLKRLGGNDQAQEVLQNVNLTICRKASEFRPGTDFLAWAFTIAKYELLTFRKNQHRERLVFSDSLAEEISLLDEHRSSTVTAEERIAALGDCVTSLPEKHRDLLHRRYGQADSISQIAEGVGRTCNAISLLLHRLRVQLMDCIQRKTSRDNNE